MKLLRAIIGLGTIAGVISTANAISVDLSGFVHGHILQPGDTPGVTIKATNNGDGPDLAVVFDTTLTGTRDDDLEGPSWAGGNLPTSTTIGNAIIVQENRNGIGDGVADLPDDEAGGGAIEFKFDMAIDSFGFDLVDIDANEFVFSFFNDGGLVGAKATANFIADNGAVFGNNTINRIAPLSFGQSFDQVVISLSGSGAVANVNYTKRVPDGGSTLLLLGGVLMLAFGFKRRLG